MIIQVKQSGDVTFGYFIFLRLLWQHRMNLSFYLFTTILLFSGKKMTYFSKSLILKSFFLVQFFFPNHQSGEDGERYSDDDEEDDEDANGTRLASTRANSSQTAFLLSGLEWLAGSPRVWPRCCLSLTASTRRRRKKRSTRRWDTETWCCLPSSYHPTCVNRTEPAAKTTTTNGNMLSAVKSLLTFTAW